MNTAERLLDDVQRFRMTATPIAARLLDVHPQRARRLLERLVHTGALRRFRFDGASYYTAARRPLSPKALRAAFAVSWFCHRQTPAVVLLASAVVRDLLDPIAVELRLPSPLPIPSYVNPTTRRLAMFVLGDGGAPAAVRRQLSRVLRKRWARVLTALIAAGQAEITFLHPEAASCASIENDLREHPLWTETRTPVAVPVQVAPLVMLEAVTRKDKSPDGAFVQGAEANHGSRRKSLVVAGLNTNLSPAVRP